MQNWAKDRVPTLTVDFCPGFVQLLVGMFVRNIPITEIWNVMNERGGQ